MDDIDFYHEEVLLLSVSDNLDMPIGAYVCIDCGSVVVDKGYHDEWHNIVSADHRKTTDDLE